MTKTLAFFLSAALAAACAGQAEVHYSGDGARPELVALDDSPGVSVVSNADEPIFFTDNTFWLYRNNTWWRSSSHRSGWARADAPPEKVTRIAQPTRYVHYRHADAGPRTGFNDRDPQPPAEARPDVETRQPSAPQPDQLQPQGAPMMPGHEPNGQGPNPPHANPLPPNQAPPVAPSSMPNP
ncbi:MAG TPA: hypothetical protein VFP84_09940 [Kofleriaceae bacterium]|nr:hypothetical protein [Kofleriaceae bacterium]